MIYLQTPDGRARIYIGAESTERQDEMNKTEGGENVILKIEGMHFTLSLVSGPALVYAVLADGFERQEKRIVAATTMRLLARIVAELPELKTLEASFRAGYANERRYAYAEIREYVDGIQSRYELRLDGGELYFVTAFTSTKVAL